MISKKELLKSWKVYVVLDDSLFSDRRELLRKFSELIRSPIDALQLRFEDFSNSFIYETAQKIARQAKKRNISLIINDRPEIVPALGADGVHLGKSDVAVSVIRRILGPGVIIGRTIRNAGDLASAEKDADYVSIGPVFHTPLKPEIHAISASEVRKICKRSRVPVVAIGGINKRNVKEVMDMGVKTVAFARYGVTGRGTIKKILEIKDILETK